MDIDAMAENNIENHLELLEQLPWFNKIKDSMKNMEVSAKESMESIQSNKQFANECAENIRVILESVENDKANNAENAQKYNRSIKDIEESAQILSVTISEKKEFAVSECQIIQKISVDIHALKKECETAKTNIEGYADRAKMGLDEVDKARTELMESIQKKNALFEEFSEQRNKINNLLADANKVGLARSFQARRVRLRFGLFIWAASFFIGIGILGWISYANPPVLTENGKLDPIALIFRFMLSAPFIWLTWFAARQYGYTVRIQEDYAFKEASALAFVGYRNEVSNDPEMLKLLQKNAIKNFGDNPAKILSKKADSPSPLYAIIEMLIKYPKKLKKLMDCINSKE